MERYGRISGMDRSFDIEYWQRLGAEAIFEAAWELCEPGVKKWPTGSEGRIERLLIKKSRTEEIRFPWWKDGRLATRPLDLSEEDLVTLFEDAIAKDVFTTEFKSRLKGLL
jgi:hypothetical protein